MTETEAISQVGAMLLHYRFPPQDREALARLVEMGRLLAGADDRAWFLRVNAPQIVGDRDAKIARQAAELTRLNQIVVDLRRQLAKAEAPR